MEGFNIAPELGAHVSIKAALGAPGLAADRKYVLAAGELVPAGAGAPRTIFHAQERMWEVCDGWMAVWRAAAAVGGAGKEGGAAKPRGRGRA